MPWENTFRNGLVENIDGDRMVRIPNEFVLVGDAITICQQKGGTISIYPATEEGIRALDSFHPFGDWTEEDEKKLEDYDWSAGSLFATPARKVTGPDARTEVQEAGDDD